MKTIIAIAFMLTFSFAAFASVPAHTPAAPTPTHEIAFPVEVGFTFELPASPVAVAKHHTKVAAVKRSVASSKVWACDAPVDLLQGSGLVTVCAWK